MKKVIFMGDQVNVDDYMAKIKGGGWSYIGVDNLYNLRMAILGHLPTVKIVVLLNGSTIMNKDYPILYPVHLIKQIKMIAGDVIIVSAFINSAVNEELRSRTSVVAEIPSNLGDKLHELSLSVKD